MRNFLNCSSSLRMRVVVAEMGDEQGESTMAKSSRLAVFSVGRSGGDVRKRWFSGGVKVPRVRVYDPSPWSSPASSRRSLDSIGLLAPDIDADREFGNDETESFLFLTRMLSWAANMKSSMSSRRCIEVTMRSPFTIESSSARDLPCSKN